MPDQVGLIGPPPLRPLHFRLVRPCFVRDKALTVSHPRVCVCASPSLFCRIVGGFEALTAMENVESDPKSDKPKVERRLSLDVSSHLFLRHYSKFKISCKNKLYNIFQEEKKKNTFPKYKCFNGIVLLNKTK